MKLIVRPTRSLNTCSTKQQSSNLCSSRSVLISIAVRAITVHSRHSLHYHLSDNYNNSPALKVDLWFLSHFQLCKNVHYRKTKLIQKLAIISLKPNKMTTATKSRKSYQPTRVTYSCFQQDVQNLKSCHWLPLGEKIRWHVLYTMNERIRQSNGQNNYRYYTS